MTSNPIGWVQLQILGGLRKQGLIVAVYTFFAATVLLLFYRATSDPSPGALQAFASTALVPAAMIQLAILFFGASHAIKKAIQRDFTTNMITSHRNTAVTGASAVWGYLTGAPSQVFLLTLANFLICQVLAVLGSPRSSPLVPGVMLIVFACPALMLLTLDIMVALSTRGAMVVTPLFVVLNFFGAMQLLDICPGLALLLTTLGGRQIMQGASPAMITERFVAMLAQLALGLTFFLAAARKFQRDDVPAFNETLAFCLLALSTLIGAIGIGLYEDGPRLFGPDVLASRRTQIIATLVPLAGVAMLPVAHAAGRCTEWMRRRRKDAEFAAKPLRSPRGFAETAIAATAVVFGILAACYQWVVADQPDMLVWNKGVPTVVWIIGTFLLALLTAGGIFYATYASGSKVAWAFVLLVIVTWLVPVVAEFGYAQFRDQVRAEHWRFSPIFGCSPVGTWILTLFRLEGPIIPGVVVQAMFAAGAGYLARRAKP